MLIIAAIGICDEAEQWSVIVMNMRKKVLSEEYPDPLVEMNELSLAYCDQDGASLSGLLITRYS